MNTPQRRLQDYGTLVQVRQRRARRWETELQELVRQHAQAQDAQAHCAQRVTRAEQAWQEYAARLAQRTAARQRVRLDEVLGAQAHCAKLGEQCQGLRQELARLEEASAEAATRCAQQRQRLARNLQRIDALQTQRAQDQGRLDRQRESDEDEERDDSWRPLALRAEA